MTQKPEFKTEEVWMVARAVVSDHADYDVGRGLNAYNECRHCGGWVYHNQDADNIVHKTDCVVLIARDLLTGAPKAVAA